MRKTVNAILHQIGRAVALPLIDDDLERDLASLLDQALEHRVRQSDVALDQIDVVPLQALDDRGDLPHRGDRVRNRRPDGIRAVDDSADAVDVRAEQPAGGGLGAQLHDIGLHVARVEYRRDASVQQGVHVAPIAEHVDRVPVPAAQEVHVHVGEPGHQHSAVQIGDRGSRWDLHLPRGTCGFDGGATYDHGRALDGGGAGAVDEHRVGKGLCGLCCSPGSAGTGGCEGGRGEQNDGKDEEPLWYAGEPTQRRAPRAGVSPRLRFSHETAPRRLAPSAT